MLTARVFDCCRTRHGLAGAVGSDWRKAPRPRSARRAEARELPPVILKPEGEYLTLLLEAWELYVEGRFYSCVAMCGIVGERLIKDVMRASVLIRTDSGPLAPPTIAFDQLERVEVSGMIRFLKEAGLLGVDAAKASDSLSQLQNQYAHARGKEPQPDALRAVQLLHSLVEDTVSVFKHYEIKDGAFVRKSIPSKSA